jgi:hypothetical protein
MVVCVGCLRASLRVLSLTLSSDSVWIRQELVTALSNKHKVNIVVWAQTKEGKSIKWLSKTPQDSDVIVHTLPHLAKTQPHNDQKLALSPVLDND